MMYATAMLKIFTLSIRFLCFIQERIPSAARKKFTPYISQKQNLRAITRMNSNVGYGD